MGRIRNPVKHGSHALGYVCGSKLWPAEGAERERALAFAERIQSPVEEAEVASDSRMSRTSGVVGLATGVIGALLITAGAISGAHAARSIDFSCGAILILLGLVSAGRRRVRPHTPNPAPLMGKR
jgi:hypothetical protein